MRFVLFGCIWDPLVALQDSVQNGLNWFKSSCHKVALEFFAMNTPNPPHWTLNSCFRAFVLFGCIWDCLVAFQYSVQNGSNWCKSSCHEVASEFFATNVPDPPHWTQNSYFCVFQTILVQLGLSGWLAKLNGKWAELVRKFVPRSRVVTFHNERTRSTPLDPKLMFWCVSYYLGAFGTVWLP